MCMTAIIDRMQVVPPIQLLSRTQQSSKMQREGAGAENEEVKYGYYY